VKRKGRKSRNQINDPILEPFFIQYDECNYSLCEKSNNDTIKTYGHYSSLPLVLLKICQLQTKKENCSLIKEYINSYNEISNKVINKFKYDTSNI